MSAGISPRSIARRKTARAWSRRGSTKRARYSAANAGSVCASVTSAAITRAYGRLAARPAHGGSRGDREPARRAGVSGGRLDSRPLVVQGVEREGLLGGPPAVDRGLADAGPLGDGVHADRGQAPREQELRGRLEDRHAGLLA